MSSVGVGVGSVSTGRRSTDDGSIGTGSISVGSDSGSSSIGSDTIGSVSIGSFTVRSAYREMSRPRLGGIASMGDSGSTDSVTIGSYSTGLGIAIMATESIA